METEKGGGRASVAMNLYLSGVFGIYKHVGLCVRPPPVSNENRFSMTVSMEGLRRVSLGTRESTHK